MNKQDEKTIQKDSALKEVSSVLEKLAQNNPEGFNCIKHKTLHDVYDENVLSYFSYKQPIQKAKRGFSALKRVDENIGNQSLLVTAAETLACLYSKGMLDSSNLSTEQKVGYSIVAGLTLCDLFSRAVTRYGIKTYAQAGIEKICQIASNLFSRKENIKE